MVRLHGGDIQTVKVTLPAARVVEHCEISETPTAA
jgi:hypothetical protein